MNDTPARKLYRVKVEYSFYVMAEDEKAAANQRVINDAVNPDYVWPDKVEAVLDDGKARLPGWTDDCLVYQVGGCDEEITLADAQRQQES